jgi:hypothetical protein
MVHLTSPRSRRQPGVALLAALLLTLLISGDGYRTVPLRQPLVPSIGMTRTICLALKTNPRLRVGMYWTAPILSSIPSLMFAPMQACVELPYDPASGAWPWLPRELLLIP